MAVQNIIDPRSALPKYHQLKHYLLREIESGTLKPGDKIATESEFTQRCNVSRCTVRQAITELVRNGDLCRRHGVGTFVAEARYGDFGERGVFAKSPSVALSLYEMNYIVDPVFAIQAKAIGEELEERGYCLCLTSTRADMIDNSQGVIILDMAVPDSKIAEVAERVPVVVIDREADYPNAASVRADNRGGAIAAMDYLVSLGHRSIVFFVESLAFPRSQQMLSGFEDAMRKHELLAERCPVEELVSDDAGNMALQAINVINRVSPTAFLFSQDKYAVTAINVLRGIGLDVPGSISVMGFNDEPLASLLSPLLTTIKVPLAELGKEACRSLLASMRGRKVEPKVLKTELLVRQSTSSILLKTQS